MQILSVLSRKGGTGKTTLAVHLAAAAQASGLNVLLGDMDPQRSALDWSRERAALEPAVVEMKPGAMFIGVQQAARAGVSDLMVLDSRSNYENEAAEAVRYADLCLIVVRPCFFDIRAIARTVELVTNMRKSGLFVINQAPSRRNGEEPRLIREAAEALEGFGLPVAPVGLRYRLAYQNAVRMGLTAQELEPDSLAAFEVNALWHHVKRELWPEQGGFARPAAHPANVRPLRELLAEAG
jgi:chromosome partitioning protein